MRLVKPTINAHLDHASPFCESCPCCLWNQIEQLAAEGDRFRDALQKIDKMGDMTDAQFRKAGGNFQIFKFVTAALRPK